jgi:hypothetical protein
MIFKLAPVVTKPCPDCSTGREVVTYPKETHDFFGAVAAFTSSPQYLPQHSYIITEPEWSTHFHVHHLEKL